MTLVCVQCGTPLVKPAERSAKYWATRKFCDLDCVKAFKTSDVRFFEKVDVRSPDECWPWLGNLDAQGYGYLVMRGRPWRASRFMYMSRKGPLHPELFVLHSCDNPLCVNPDHLRLGTAADNSRDMVTRGRQCAREGEKNTQAKLNEGDVRAILASSASVSELADMFGVTHGAISMIRSRKRWRHVN